jgi:predicted dehydrogenase
VQNEKIIKVGIAGLGRSGWGIHAHTLKDLKDCYHIAAVADIDESRTTEAKAAHGCRAYNDVVELVNDADVDLIVVATPNRFHADHALLALEAGKHVVCEKPFGFTVADVDAMIAAAEKSGVVLQPFQQRRYEPDFQKVKEICASGVLGKITFIRTAWHGFKRRWDWQTSRSFGAVNCITMARTRSTTRWNSLAMPSRKVWCELRHSLTAAMSKTKCASSSVARTRQPFRSN